MRMTFQRVHLNAHRSRLDHVDLSQIVRIKCRKEHRGVVCVCLYMLSRRFRKRNFFRNLVIRLDFFDCLNRLLYMINTPSIIFFIVFRYTVHVCVYTSRSISVQFCRVTNSCGRLWRRQWIFRVLPYKSKPVHSRFDLKPLALTVHKRFVKRNK